MNEDERNKIVSKLKLLNTEKENLYIFLELQMYDNELEKSIALSLLENLAEKEKELLCFFRNGVKNDSNKTR